jgi:hypothetical protein
MTFFRLRTGKLAMFHKNYGAVAGRVKLHLHPILIKSGWVNALKTNSGIASKVLENFNSNGLS